MHFFWSFPWVDRSQHFFSVFVILLFKFYRIACNKSHNQLNWTLLLLLNSIFSLIDLFRLVISICDSNFSRFSIHFASFSIFCYPSFLASLNKCNFFVSPDSYQRKKCLSIDIMRLTEKIKQKFWILAIQTI